MSKRQELQDKIWELEIELRDLERELESLPSDEPPGPPSPELDDLIRQTRELYKLPPFKAIARQTSGYNIFKRWFK